MEAFQLSTSGERIGSAASGFAVIVIGVLVALAADSAWGERAERIREQEVLRDLLEEFQQNEALLRSDIEGSRVSRAAAESWAEAMMGQALVSSDSLAVLWQAGLEWERFDPVTGTLRSVVEGGEISLIRDPKLRHALAGWPDEAEETRMTSRAGNVVISGFAPVALSLSPGGPHSWSDKAVIQLFVTYSEGSLFQLTPLLERLLEIITLIEDQLTP